MRPYDYSKNLLKESKYGASRICTVMWMYVILSCTHNESTILTKIVSSESKFSTAVLSATPIYSLGIKGTKHPD